MAACKRTRAYRIKAVDSMLYSCDLEEAARLLFH